MEAFLKQLDAKVPNLLERLHLPGIALALIEDFEVAAIRTYGHADTARGLPVAPETIFRLASISKSVAAWGVMKLVEGDLLDLDAPVASYLTRWRLPESRFNHDHITARRILSHIAGLSAGGCDAFLPADPLPSHEDCLSGRRPTPLDPLQLEYFANVGLDALKQQQALTVVDQPGAHFNYSNSGYSLLQLMIEEISGRAFADFMQEEVLRPLGMRASTFHDVADGNPAVATPYDEAGTAVPYYRYVLKAAGGLSASIADLAVFACAGMAGPRGEPPGRGVLSPASVAQMHTAPVYAESEMGFDFFAGLGHFTTRAGGMNVVQHSGGFIGWRSIMTFMPAAGVGFVALINSSGGNPLWQELITDWGSSLR